MKCDLVDRNQARQLGKPAEEHFGSAPERTAVLYPQAPGPRVRANGASLRLGTRCAVMAGCKRKVCPMFRVRNMAEVRARRGCMTREVDHCGGAELSRQSETSQSTRSAHGELHMLGTIDAGIRPVGPTGARSST